ncbi:MAG: winged helix-turn-helix transcriptional regulator [Roseibium sp.]|uniref:MarR family winged helix-turn-helix transcriptional regulator n=1 Tax=Roseibium sp. TaxID=1936156 RepID=UPI001B27270C|nr:MarR family winged helix-turn-helix transcriptional regulator [Roseibium sp.]MBO6509140.1 winged helix-turn-helix transcriptional regulator [Roseibium sp.]MBO6892479.1 winged helix-turn-helix transcriptional regulator [Roseibium sp.]MBO6931220.1 winged helix-turn-helix transcriptional regulator [Roseibium sp.]
MEQDDFTLCVLNNARKAARAVSRHYDRLARQVGMTAGQFSVLVAIRQTNREMTGELAERLSMDRTTLVRNIALLERDGLVSSVMSEDGRGKCYQLTDKGTQLLEDALPLWRQAQGDVMEHLGEENFLKTISALKKLSSL